MWLSILIPILLTILVIVCVLLTLVVLMQRPRSEGLGAAFGSGMTENIFGAQTTTVLTKATTYLGGIFFGVTLLLTMLTARQSSERRTGLLENELKNTKPAPTATVAPKTSAVPEATASPKVSVIPISSATPQVSNTPVSSPSAALKEEAKPTATPAAQNSPVATPSATP
jgi:preprotein translocase subunit SecG